MISIQPSKVYTSFIFPGSHWFYFYSLNNTVSYRLHSSWMNQQVVYQYKPILHHKKSRSSAPSLPTRAVQSSLYAEKMPLGLTEKEWNLYSKVHGYYTCSNCDSWNVSQLIIQKDQAWMHRTMPRKMQCWRWMQRKSHGEKPVGVFVPVDVGGSCSNYMHNY